MREKWLIRAAIVISLLGAQAVTAQTPVPNAGKPAPMGAPASPVQPTPAPTASVPPPLPNATTPPPLPPTEAPTFFVEANGRPEGPLTLQQVAERITARSLTGSTLVWRSGTPNWQQAQQVAELRPYFATVPPPEPRERRFERLMIGTWEEQSRQGPVMVVTTMRFSPDGTFSGVQRSQMAGTNLPPLATPVSGSWRVEAISEQRFVLTLNPREAVRPSSATHTVMGDHQIRNEETGAVARRINQ